MLFWFLEDLITCAIGLCSRLQQRSAAWYGAARHTAFVVVKRVARLEQRFSTYLIHTWLSGISIC